MRSPWNDVTALIDADILGLWAHAGRRPRRGSAPDAAVAHEGRPADALSYLLPGLPKARLPICNRIHVVAGHPWSHSVVLPWQEGLVSDAAWDAYARMLFAARAQRGALRIRIEDERHGRARLAVAACDEVIAALVEASRAAGWRIASFHDALSASLGAHAVELSADDFGFVLRQPRVVTCIFRRSGEWRDVVTLPRVGERAADWFAAAALLAGQPPSVDAYEGQFDGTTFSAGDDAGAPPRIAQTDLTAWPEPTAPTALTEPTTASAEAPA